MADIPVFSSFHRPRRPIGRAAPEPTGGASQPQPETAEAAPLHGTPSVHIEGDHGAEREEPASFPDDTDTEIRHPISHTAPVSPGEPIVGASEPQLDVAEHLSVEATPGAAIPAEPPAERERREPSFNYDWTETRHPINHTVPAERVVLPSEPVAVADHAHPLEFEETPEVLSPAEPVAEIEEPTASSGDEYTETPHPIGHTAPASPTEPVAVAEHAHSELAGSPDLEETPDPLFLAEPAAEPAAESEEQEAPSSVEQTETLHPIGHTAPVLPSEPTTVADHSHPEITEALELEDTSDLLIPAEFAADTEEQEASSGDEQTDTRHLISHADAASPSEPLTVADHSHPEVPESLEFEETPDLLIPAEPAAEIEEQEASFSDEQTGTPHPISYTDAVLPSEPITLADYSHPEVADSLEFEETPALLIPAEIAAEIEEQETSLSDEQPQTPHPISHVDAPWPTEPVAVADNSHLELDGSRELSETPETTAIEEQAFALRDQQTDIFPAVEDQDATPNGDGLHVPVPGPEWADLTGILLECDQLGLANPSVISLVVRWSGYEPVTLTAGRAGIYRPAGFRPAPWSGFAYEQANDTSTGVAAGTRILTARGEIEVEKLIPGDAVMTLRGPALLPISWIGRSVAAAPSICIETGAIGPDVPRRTIYLGPDQAIFVEPVPVAARKLVNGTTIREVEEDPLDLFHVDVGQAEVLFAEGLPLSSGHRASQLAG